MSELEPDDSRDVTLSTHRAPGEPPRTGPRESEARAQAGQGEPGAGDGRAIEGDAPAHPDRFGGTAQHEVQEDEAPRNGAPERDRWSEAADREGRAPDGK